MVILSACHNDTPKSPVYRGADKPDPSPYARSTRATRFADEFKIDCSSGVCPEGVGVLFISNYLVSGLCTAFVAGEFEGHSVLMTNRHCVEKTDACDQEIAFRIPSTTESAQCKRILKISEYALSSKKKNNLVPDYAFILLDRKLNAKVLPLSQNGLAPQSPVTIRKAWSTGARSVEMREHACATGDAGLFTGNYASPLSPNISLYDCKGKGGVSGAPILNAQGEVAALLQRSTDGETSRLPTFPGLDDHQFNIDSIAIATNLACVGLAELGLQPHSSCAANIVVGDGADNFNINRMLNEWVITSAVIADYIKFLNTDKDQLFGWAIRKDDGERVSNFTEGKGFFTFELAPSCVIRATDENGALKKKFYTEPTFLGLYGGGWMRKGAITHATPGWSARLQLDKYAKVTIRFVAGTKMATYTFTPRQLADLREGETAKVTERVVSTEIVHKLPPCATDHFALEMADALEMQRIVQRGDQQALKDFMTMVAARNKKGKE